MPRAPQREQQVQAQALPGVRLQAAPSAESFGANTGQLASRIGMALYEQEILDADRTATFEADRQAADLQTRLEQKLQQTRGKNVLGMDVALRKEWDDGLAKIDGGLSNDRQKAGFSRIRATRSDQLNRTTQHHIATQYEAFQDQETEAGVNSVIDRVRANPGQPEVIAGEMQRANSLLAAAAQRKGLMGSVTEAQVQSKEFRKSYEDRGETVPSVGDQFLSDRYMEQRAAVGSKIHSAVVNGFLAKNDDLSAKKYFEMHAHDFVASDRQALEKVVLEGSTIGHARRIVNGWVDNGYNEAKMLEDARKQGEKDPKLGELLRNYSIQYVADKQAAEKRVDERNFETTSKFIKERIAKEPGVFHDPRTELGLDKYLALSPATQDYLDRTAREAMSHEKPVTDLNVWVKINAMKDEDLEKMTVDQMTTALKFLDEGDRDKLLTRWNGVRNQKAGQKDVKYEELFSNKQLLDNAMEQTGYFDLTKPRSKWPVEHQQLENRVQKLVDQALSHIPKDAPREKKEKAIQDIVDAQVKAKVKVDKGVFSFEKERAVGEFEDFKDAASIRVPLKEIPVNDQDTIKGLLRQAEKKLDPGKIERIYALKQLQKAGKIDRQALIDQTRKIVQE